jgi:hypothetical protein
LGLPFRDLRQSHRENRSAQGLNQRWMLGIERARLIDDRGVSFFGVGGIYSMDYSKVKILMKYELLGTVSPVKVAST